MSLASASSGAITEDATVSAGPCIVWGITLNSGTTASSIVLKDGGSGGVAKWGITNIGTTGAGDTTVSVMFPKGIVFSIDCYADWTGTGAIGYVAYEKL